MLHHCKPVSIPSENCTNVSSVTESQDYKNAEHASGVRVTEGNSNNHETYSELEHTESSLRSTV